MLAKNASVGSEKMSIKRIVKMKNFGRYSDTLPINFNKNTVIFGFNGMGKSTLSAIFYSLVDSEKDALIRNRTRLKEKESDEKKEVYIEVETDTDKYIFSNGSWNKRLTTYTFNGEYVQDNVLVSSVTKRAGTYSVELDKDIIKLDFKKQELSKKIEQSLLVKVNEIFLRYNDQIKSVAATGNAKTVKRGSVNIKKLSEIELFLKSRKDEIEKNLKDTNKYDMLFKKVEEVQTRLQNIPINSFNPIDISFLKKTLEMIPSVTPEEICIHMKRYFKRDNPQWLIQGVLNSLDLSSCPFCGQEITDKRIINFVKTIQKFALSKKNERIKDIKDNVIFFLRLLDSKAISDAFLEYGKIIDDMWTNELFKAKKYDFFKSITGAFDNDVLDVIIIKLRQKSEQPFDTFLLSEHEIVCIKKVNLLFQRLAALKDYLKECEIKLNTQKTKDKNILKTKALFDLSFGSARLEIEEMISSAREIIKLENEIVKIENMQSDMREKIHLENISKELKDLNAKFSIIKENGRFYIKLRNFDEKVEFDKNTDERSKYVLSEGDQRALAFAYFLFELNQHRNEPDKIIVFDDPISSLDLNRKSIIAYKISELMKDGTSQIIVLSHDISFVEKIQHFHKWATFYMLTNKDDVVTEFDINDFILSDSEIYKRFITDAVSCNNYNNAVIALMSLRPLYEITQKKELCTLYYKFSTYFNHSIYARLQNYKFSVSKYNIKRIRKYINHVAKKIGFQCNPEQIVPDEFNFIGLDYDKTIELYESLSGDDIMTARKKALLIRVLLEVLMIKLSANSYLKCDNIGKEYQKIINKLKKGSEEHKFAKKIVEAYNQTKKFHHGAGMGSMLGLSWINPDEIEYYDSIVKEIISYTKPSASSTIVTTTA